MRCVLLQSHQTEGVQHLARLTEEEFIASGKLFLSALAAIDEEHLMQLRSKLFPHELWSTSDVTTFESSSSFASTLDPRGPVNQTIQAGQPVVEVDSIGQPSSNSTCAHPDRELFQTYTALERISSPERMDTPGSMSQVQELEMRQAEALQEFDASGDLEISPATGSSRIRDSSSMISTEMWQNTVPVSTPQVDPTSAEGTLHVCRRPSSSMSRSSSPLFTSISPDRNRASHSIRDSQHSNQTPPHNSTSQTPSHFARAFSTLSSQCGEHSKYALMPTNVIKVIEIGDSFLRQDAEDFILFHLSKYRNSLWSHPVESNPTADGPLTEQLFKSFHCAELLQQRSAVDPLRLRVARVLLYWYYEQLLTDMCISLATSNRRPCGRSSASIATDQLLEKVYHSWVEKADPQAWKRHRTSIQKHKQIGKRWTILITFIGPGILLLASSEMAAHIDNGTFSERIIEGFLTYIINVYPKAVEVCGLLDQFSVDIIKGKPSINRRPGKESLEAIKAYNQDEEKGNSEFQKDWRLIEAPEFPAGTLNALFG